MSGVVAGLRSVLVANAGVNAVVVGRVFSKVAPPVVESLTHILLHRQDEDHNLALDGTDGSLVFAGIDVDCKATNPTVADSLAILVKNLLRDFTGVMGDVTCQAVLLEDVSDSYEPPQHKDEVGRYLVTLQFQIQYSE